jgi:hypothetical protein
MSQKYLSPRIVTNDLYLAAFLLCQGCDLLELLHNGRRRMSFVFVGERVHELKREYEDGVVRLNVRSFKDNLLTVRQRMDAEQRSAALCPEPSPIASSTV